MGGKLSFYLMKRQGASVCITMVLYIVFSGMLSVNLPRGTIGFLRNFALWLESIVAAVKSIF